MTRTLPAVAILAVMALASPAYAQAASPQPTDASGSQQPTLGALAKQEAARRKADAAKGDAPKKVYTNSDLKAAPPPETADADKTAAGDQTKADAQKTDDKSAQGDSDKKDADKTPPERTQPYWHDRMQKAKDDLQHNQMYAEALQSRINALSADFAARDDPYQRAQIADDRQKALAELDRVNDEIKKGQQAISDIEDEARKANIPAGWIR
jgi:hypothetical protein